MTTYSDSAGNVFLGDAIYSAGTSKLTGYPFSSISNGLISLCQTAGLVLRPTPTQSIGTQASFDSNTTSWMSFSPQGDITQGRYAIRGLSMLFGTSQMSDYSRENQVLMFNNSGNTATNPSSGSSPSGTVWAAINRVGNVATSGLSAGLANDPLLVSQSQFIGCADSQSLALVHFVYSGNDMIMRFCYAGRLIDVNPNYAYYNTSVETDSVLLTNNTSLNASVSISTPIGAVHRIAGSHKQILTTGDAQYPIVCSDGQSPTYQWATDMYVFDNNATLGYPAIGRVRNLLLAQGTYTIGKPVRIQGTVQPDNGFNAWLPIGTFGDKVVLMRCYSSVDL